MRKTLLGAGFVLLAVGVVVTLRRSTVQAEIDQSAGLVSAPEFSENTKWLQSKPLTLASLRGEVVIVHFWTFGCSNCQHNYPVYRAWQEKYAGKGVRIIGVHTPELAREADMARVRARARDNGLKFPIAIDNDKVIWQTWNNRYWPCIYLIDKQGRVRQRWDGELHLEDVKAREFASRIDALLAERATP